MIINFGKYLCILMILVLGSGCCSLRLGDFTSLSSKNIPVEFEHSEATVGRSIRSFLFSFIPMEGPPRIEEAINDALKNKDGDALINLQIKYSWTIIPLIYAQDMYEVRGDAIRTRKSPAQEIRPTRPRFYP